VIEVCEFRIICGIPRRLIALRMHCCVSEAVVEEDIPWGECAESKEERTKRPLWPHQHWGFGQRRRNPLLFPFLTS